MSVGTCMRVQEMRVPWTLDLPREVITFNRNAAPQQLPPRNSDGAGQKPEIMVGATCDRKEMGMDGFQDNQHREVTGTAAAYGTRKELILELNAA